LIHRIFSEDLTTFKELAFGPGFNIVVAEREEGASKRQSRNRSGKSSLILLIQFLLGAQADRRSLFRCPALKDYSFSMDFDLGEFRVVVSRTGRDPAIVTLTGDSRIFAEIGQPSIFSNRTETRKLKLESWKALLGSHLFGFPFMPSESKAVSTRSLLSYFARVQANGGFAKPHRCTDRQSDSDAQISSAWLLGLDIGLLIEWQQWREKKRLLANLKRISSMQMLDKLLGRPADLQKELSRIEARIAKNRPRLAEFQIVDSHDEIVKEIDELTVQINDALVEQAEDQSYLLKIQRTVTQEQAPQDDEVLEVYNQLGFHFPESALRRFEDVRRFHESVVRNRRTHLATEERTVEGRIARGAVFLRDLEQRRSAKMKVRESSGALEQFLKYQVDMARDEAQATEIRIRLERTSIIEKEADSLESERQQREDQLKSQVREQEEIIEKISQSINDRMSALYDDGEAELVVEVTTSGIDFTVDAPAGDAGSVSNMSIFVWDLAVLESLVERRFGPGFLVHDSPLFDPVEGRQLGTAIRLGAEASANSGFQYIVTMNSDDLSKAEFPESFDIEPYKLKQRLTDATDSGGLFGFRFRRRRRKPVQQDRT